MTDVTGIASEAWRLAHAGHAEEALARLHRLTKENPGSAIGWFELAGMLDWLGREEDALSPYERAAHIGLPDALRPQWALQYGSTLRNVGRTADAIRVLEKAVRRHAEYPALDLMLGLSLLDEGQPEAAAVAALEAALKPDPDGSLGRYRRALTGYVEGAARRRLGQP